MDEAAFRKLVSGRTRGIIPAVSRGALMCLEPFYAAAVWGRNRSYDVGLLHTHRVPPKVVSIGNITTGGTGKTPFVAWVANWFKSQGHKVGILSRGYRSLPGEANDERLVLDQRCPGIPHVQCRDRVAGTAQLQREFDCEIVVLDDGFQHRRLARDLNIVLIDALNPWGYGHLLPRGLLRESLREISRADIVVVTRADQCSPGELSNIHEQLNRYGYRGEQIEISFQPVQLRNDAGETEEMDWLDGRSIVAFCGIGNPESFRETLKTTGCDVGGFRTYPDHFHYGANDIASIADLAKQAGVASVITTQKDLVKIPETTLAECPLWAIEIGAEFRTGRAVFEGRLDGVMGWRAN